MILRVTSVSKSVELTLDNSFVCEMNLRKYLRKKIVEKFKKK